MEQTAVEWLIKRYHDYGTLYYEDMTKAREMEKEKIIENNKLKAIVEFYEQGCGKEGCKVKEPHVH